MFCYDFSFLHNCFDIISGLGWISEDKNYGGLNILSHKIIGEDFRIYSEGIYAKHIL